MRLSRVSVHRPVFTVMVVLVVLILGGVSLVRLPIDLMPDISYPTLSVSCTYENASPEEIEELITRPLEQALSSVPGVEEFTSSSTEGQSRVRVLFTWGTDLDAASNDIRDRLDRIIDHLPDDAERPTLRKFDLASFPIMFLGASSNLDPIQMRRVLDDQVRYRLERVPGVAAVDIWGGLVREIHVDLLPEKVKALGLPLDQIVQRIKDENLNLPAGTIDQGNMEVTVRMPGEYTSVDELRQTVVAMREGVPIQLGEIAQVEDSSQKVQQIIRMNGRPGVRLAVNKQSGKNTVDVADRVRKEIERINREMPQIQIIPLVDTSQYIRNSISNVGDSALYGGLLAIAVLLFFLRNVRSTFIIATAIPTSIIATFVLMYFGHFTLNIMTLGGLALGVGMLVDNAIVVLENIYRLREGGEAAEPAAVNGSEEVTAAIVSSTLTTVVVFLPLVFVRGMAGVMFTQLSIVISFALLCSMAVAMTLVPMLAAKILPADIGVRGKEKLGHRIFRVTALIFDRIESGYKRLLHSSLNHRFLVVLGVVTPVAASLLLIPLIGVELMPAADEGEVQINAEMAVGTRLDLVDKTFAPVEAIVREAVPEATNIVTNIGGGGGYGGGGSHVANMRIVLRPAKERTRSSEQVAADLRRKLQNVPGLTVRTRAGQGLFLLRMGTSGTDRVQVEIRGHDLDTADALAAQVERVVEGVDGVTDARLSRESGRPEEELVIDRQKAADLKLTVSGIANAIQTILAGTQAGNYRDSGDEYVILVKIKEAEKLDLREILDLTITNADGQPVVLRNVISSGPRTGPMRIERKNQERIVTVSANITGRDMGSILEDIRRGLRSVPVPEGFSIAFGGDYEEQQKAFNELLLSIILALILVYMVMACQYESLVDPFVVMFSVPLAVIGVVLILFLTNTTFNVQSYIGCIMLGGIVVNNAILLVDHTNLLRRRDGMELRAAIEEAGRRRLRPVLMTALTTILGLLPLALGFGEGGEAQAPLARTVIGGLTSAALITLVFVPVVYSLFERGLGKGEPIGESQELTSSPI